MKKFGKTDNDNSLDNIKGNFMAVIGFLIANLFLNILELITSLSCISNCHCCNSYCCHDFCNNSSPYRPSENQNTEDRETERNAVIMIHQRIRRTEIEIGVNRNNFVVNNVRVDRK